MVVGNSLRLTPDSCMAVCINLPSWCQAGGEQTVARDGTHALPQPADRQVSTYLHGHQFILAHIFSPFAISISLRALLTSSETEQELSHVVKTLKDKQAAMIGDELPQLHRLIIFAESRLEAAHQMAMLQREADRQAAVELQLQQAAREARETIQKAREEGREDVLNCAICNDEEKRIMIRPCVSTEHFPHHAGTRRHAYPPSIPFLSVCVAWYQGHLCMCRGCYNDLMGKPVADRLCPVCRRNIEGHVNVFLQ